MPKTEVVSAQTVNEGNDGNEAGGKMWGQGERTRFQDKVEERKIMKIIKRYKSIPADAS